jgi:hypothetical protein
MNTTTTTAQGTPIMSKPDAYSMHPRRPRLDLTVNLGHILTIVSIIGSVVFAWRQLEIAQIRLEEQLHAFNERTSKIESTIAELGKTQNQLAANLSQLQGMMYGTPWKKSNPQPKE